MSHIYPMLIDSITTFLHATREVNLSAPCWCLLTSRPKWILRFVVYQHPENIAVYRVVIYFWICFRQ